MCFAAGKTVMASPESTSGNVNVSRLNTNISAVLTELDSILSIKQEQEYATAVCLGKNTFLKSYLKIRCGDLAIGFGKSLIYQHVPFCTNPIFHCCFASQCRWLPVADWQRELVCQGKHSRPLKSMWKRSRLIRVVNQNGNGRSHDQDSLQDRALDPGAHSVGGILQSTSLAPRRKPR